MNHRLPGTSANDRPLRARLQRRAAPIVRAAVGVMLLSLTGCAAPEQSEPILPTIRFAGLDPEDSTGVRATGIVTGVAESGGKCSFTFWGDSGAATRLGGTGLAEGDHTLCGPVTVGLGFMVGGSYDVELRYTSLSGKASTGHRVPMVLPTPSTLNPI